MSPKIETWGTAIVKGRSRVGHAPRLYSGYGGADEDVRATAGREAGVTRKRLLLRSRAPNPGPVLQSCFGGVFDDVTDGAGGLVSIANQAVVVLSVPESAFASECVVGGFGREVFPGLDDRGKLPAREEFYYYMNVVGHDAPGKKPVMLSLAEAQGRGHGAGDAMVHECARANAAVEVLFDAWLAICGEPCFLFR